MKFLSIIPARGGSKGIKLKNVQEVGGLPLVARTVEASLKSVVGASTFVATDSQEIADVAKAAGAQIIWRTAEISSDTASSESVLLFALEKLEEKPEYIVFLQCTSPFVSHDHINFILNKIEKSDYDSMFATVSNHRFLWKTDDKGIAYGVNHDGKLRKRRQELEPEFLETGAIYVMKTDTFLAEKTRFCGKVGVCNFDDEILPYEIDSQADLLIARGIAATLSSEKYSTKEIIKDVKILISDFDGVFTDDKVYVDQYGNETVRCDRSDGLGIEMLRKKNIPVIVISKERNPVVSARCNKLKIECHQGIDDKVAVIHKIIADRGLSFQNVCYIGNDVNDVPCLSIAGLPVTPNDAKQQAKEKAKLILKAAGGNGAIRELCDILMKE